MSTVAATTLVSRQVVANGVLQIRLDKTVTNGDQVLVREPHRFAIAPGMNIADVRAAVDAGLGSIGYPPLPASEWAQIDRMAANEWTPEVIAGYQALTA